MDKTRYAIIAAGIAVALLIGVGGFAVGRATAPQDVASTDGSQAASAQATAPISSLRNPARDASGNPNPTTAPGSNPASGGAKGEPPTRVVPKSPVKAGTKLATVETPPAKTLAMLNADVATKDSEYKITFKPYGYGPSNGPTKMLVVQITSCVPVKDYAKPAELDGKNLLASVADGVLDDIKLGGEYSGTLKLVERKGLLAFEITAASAK